MKRLSPIAVVLALVAAGCSNNNSPSPTTPTNPTFTAALSPANEVPPITNAESGGSGQMTITLVVTRDSANNITAATANFVGSFQGFPAGTTLTV